MCVVTNTSTDHTDMKGINSNYTAVYFAVIRAGMVIGMAGRLTMKRLSSSISRKRDFPSPSEMKKVCCQGISDMQFRCYTNHTFVSCSKRPTRRSCGTRCAALRLVPHSLNVMHNSFNNKP